MLQLSVIKCNFLRNQWVIKSHKFRAIFQVWFNYLLTIMPSWIISSSMCYKVTEIIAIIVLRHFINGNESIPLNCFWFSWVCNFDVELYFFHNKWCRVMLNHARKLPRSLGLSIVVWMFRCIHVVIILTELIWLLSTWWIKTYCALFNIYHETQWAISAIKNKKSRTTDFSKNSTVFYFIDGSKQ